MFSRINSNKISLSYLIYLKIKNVIEIAGGIIIAVFALIFLGTLANFWHKKIAFGKVQKVLEMIVNNPSNTTSSEEEDETLKKVQLVQFKCRYAENFIEDINSNIKEISDSGKEKLESYIQTCLATAQEVSEEFGNSAILHSISNLLSKSGQFERANKLIDLMVVDFMQDQARELMDAERKKRFLPDLSHWCDKIFQNFFCLIGDFRSHCNFSFVNFVKDSGVGDFF